MDFLNLNETYNEKDRPRFLTEDEINAILDVLPTTYSADEYEGKVIREAIQKDLRDKLMDKKLAPSAISHLANDIVKHYTTSRIAAGLSVGAHAAESSAHAPMQAALNSIAPYEKLILQDLSGHGFITEIGPWIDQLLNANQDKIQLIPKNETELLELDEPVFISSCNEDGKVSWNHVTHITRHLPKGDLVKIKTKSGREVTATQSKSLLKWDDETRKIIPIKGKHIKIGDKIPVHTKIPNPPKTLNVILSNNQTICLDYKYGERVSKELLNCDIPEEFLYGTEEFILGILSQLPYNHYFNTEKRADDYLYLCGRVGIFAEKIKIKDEFMVLIKTSYQRCQDVVLDPIVSIDYVKDIKYVYDLTVPDTLHFSLFNGINLMDSFHSSGQSKSGSSGINGIEELLYLKKNRKYEICTIHYKNKSLTYEEVLETKKDIVGCTVIELIQDELYIKEGKNYVKDITIDFYRNLPKKWFHNEEYIKNILETEVPPDDAYVLRIKLNLYQLYIYKITIEDIIDAFKRELDSPIQLIYGSMLDGIIDIYACSDYNEKQKLVSVECKTTSNPVISAAYYQTIIIPSFDTLRIKGVQGISNLTPIVAPVVSIIINDDEQYFYFTTTTNIKDLLVLFNLVGIKVLKYNNDYFLRLPAYDNQRLSLSKSEYELLTPISFIEGLIADEPSPKVKKQLSILKTFKLIPVYLITLSPKHIKKNGVDKVKLIELLTTINVKVVREEEYKLYVDKKDVRKTVNSLIDDNPLIRKAAEVIYAEVSGTNLRGLLALNFVDQQRTISNNIHVIAQVLGIRAARAYFIEDLYNIMSGYSLHPQHVLTIADVYFHRGTPYGAQNLSVNKNLGPIDKASVAKPADVFKSSAILGINHEITGVASNIIFGLPPKVGTGYLDVGYENKKLLLNTDIYKQFKKVDKKILEQIDEVEETEDPLVAPTLLVGKTVSVKPAATTAAPFVSRFQRTIIDKDKTEKKRGKK